MLTSIDVKFIFDSPRLSASLGDTAGAPNEDIVQNHLT